MILQIVLIFFLIRRNGALAIRKGLKVVPWKLFTALAWFAAELTGWLLGALLFGNTNIVAISSIGLLSAFGGYLIVRAILERKPDHIDEDINRIGVDDLKPPVNK